MNLNLNDNAVLLLSITALILLISHDWRLSVSSLGVLYLGVFTLVLISWPMEMAVVKLVAGWISASVLGIGLANLGNRQYRPNRYLPSEIIFRFSAAGLVSLVAISLTPSLLEWLPGASYEQALGGLILIGMGLLILGYTQRPLQTALGLLTFFAGFEIMYVTIESSVLVAGFLALINMGVALVFAYLLLAPTLEVEE
jgi:hypothetical protein